MRFHSTKERWTFGVLMACAILFACATFSPLWKPLLFAAVLATTLDGWNERLVKRVRNKRAIAAAIMTLGVMVLVLLPVGIVVGYAVKQGLAALQYVRGNLDGEANGTGMIASVIKLLPDRVEGWVKQLLELLPTDAFASAGAWAADQMASFFTASWEMTFQVGIALIGLYFLLIDGRNLVEWFTDALPLGKAATRDLFSEFHDVSRAVIGSTLATATAQGLVAGIGYQVAGVPNAFFFGVITWFAAFIPSVGTALVAIPITAHLYLTDHPGWGTFLLIWSVLIVGLIDNLLKPFLVGSDKMNGAIAFFAFIGGLIVWGGIGLIAGPLAVSFFLTMARLAKSEPAPPAAT